MSKTLLTVLCLLFTGCATAVTTNSPANHFITPESSGGFLDGSAALGFGEGDKLTIIPDALATPLSNQGSITKEAQFMGNVWLGILSRLDLQLVNQSATFGLKYQILGETRTTAKAGNFSLAISAMGGSISYKDTYNDLLRPSVTASSSTSVDTYDLTLEIGYRTTDITLLYLGPYYTHNAYHGALVQTPTNGSTTNTDYSGLFQEFGMKTPIFFSMANSPLADPLAMELEAPSIVSVGSSLDLNGARKKNRPNLNKKPR